MIGAIFTIVARLIKGYFIHRHSKDEALGDLDLYKMECSRLWRYLDSEIGLSKVYLTFYELILQKIKSHLNGTYSGTSGWVCPKSGIIEFVTGPRAVSLTESDLFLSGLNPSVDLV